MKLNDKIFVAGNTGLVGSAIVRRLEAERFDNLVFAPYPEYDLRRQDQCEGFLEKERPDYVFLAAAKVGGIHANNTYPAEFIYDNLMISANVIHSAWKSGVKKLINLGSSCIYPKLAEQPMKETALLSGTLEPTNEPYALAKIAAVKLAHYYNKQYGTDFISAMPTNLYGPADNYDLANSHVLPALIRKFHEAKVQKKSTTVVWGTGTPKREFLYSDDLVDALLFLMQNSHASDIGEFINIGTGKDLTIRELAELIRDIVGFDGGIEFDTSRPDGTPQKLLDVSRMTGLGWQAKTDLRTGIEKAYQWFLKHGSPSNGAAQ